MRLSQLPMLSGRYVSRFWSAFNMESFLSFPAVGIKFKKKVKVNTPKGS